MKTGLLLLSINGEPLLNKSHEATVNLLKNSTRPLNLELTRTIPRRENAKSSSSSVLNDSSTVGLSTGVGSLSSLSIDVNQSSIAPSSSSSNATNVPKVFLFKGDVDEEITFDDIVTSSLGDSSNPTESSGFQLQPAVDANGKALSVSGVISVRICDNSG